MRLALGALVYWVNNHCLKFSKRINQYFINQFSFLSLDVLILA